MLGAGPLVARLRQDPTLLARALALFERLVEEPPEEREAALAELGLGDAGLEEAVRWLLEQDGRAGGFLAEPPDTGDLREQQSWVGRRIASYRIRRVLGEGGMSRVFRAEDDEGRPVAIKVLRRGVSPPDLERLFERERTILETLRHPRIARLLHSGVTADGLRYLVMEFVDGTPITEHCDSHRLGIEKRLRLVRTVCEAVHQAHVHLVAHRDLKPANILVTRDGEAKLLDFGIAKLLDAEDVTETGRRLLTPSYASPEQLLGGRITVATDVYSLGVLLYELTTGRRPREAGKRLPAELAEALEAHDAVAPSRALREPGADSDDLESVAAARSTDPTALVRRLSGDLDAIVGKALRYRPGERYGSALELADDLGRFLSGRPVLARRSTLGYRARKFARRHPVSVTLVTLAFTALAVGSTLHVVQSIRVREQRDRYRQVLEYLTGSYALLSPGSRSGPDLDATELLEREAERLERDLGAEPEARAAITHSIGNVYFDLGLYDEAVELLEEALALRRRIFGTQSLEVAETLHSLLYAATRRADLARAEEAAREALEIRRRHLPEGSPPIAGSLHGLAMVLVRAGEHDLAIDLVREALSIHRATAGSEAAVASDLIVLSEALVGHGDLEAAHTVAREAVAVNRAVHGENHLESVAALDRLADALFHLGRAAEAEPLSRRVHTLYSERLGERHPDTARSSNQLALVLWRRGELEEAEDHFRRALRLSAAALGPDHPDLASIEQNLGLVLRSRGAYAEAEEAMRGALERFRQISPSGDRSVALALNNLASVRTELGDRPGALELYRQALRMFRSVEGERHPDVAMVLNNLGGLHLRAARYEEAEDRYRRSLEIVQGTAGSESLFVAILWNNLGKVAYGRGEVARTEELQRRALALLDRIDGDSPSRWRATVRYDLGQTLRREARREEARSLFALALETRRRLLGEEHPETLLAHLALLDVSPGEATRESAEPRCLDLLGRLRSSLPSGHLDLAPALLVQARIELRSGRPGAARASAQEALEISERHLGDEHWEVDEARQVLAETGGAAGRERAAATAGAPAGRVHSPRSTKRRPAQVT